ALADHVEDLAAFVEFIVNNRQPRLALQGLELEGDPRWPLALHVFVKRLPLINETARRIAFEDRIVVRLLAGGIDGCHALPGLAIGFNAISEPVFLAEIRLGERLPYALGRRGNVSDVDELRLTHHAPPDFSSIRSTPANASVQTSQSSARRSHGSVPDSGSAISRGRV